MKLGSLFSGGGLGDFGFMAAGMEVAWQCEIDDYCQKILELRYPESKKYRDIKQLKGGELEPVDIITGGFPCQPFSVAGKQKGKEDNRYLWPEMLRVIDECRPRWVVGENVPGIINLALDTVCADLEAKGYEVWPIVFPSHAVGAWHKRDRLWLVAYRNDDKQEQSQRNNQKRGLSPKPWSSPRIGTGSGIERGDITERSEQLGGDTAVLQTVVAHGESVEIQGLRSSGEQKPNTHGKQGLPLCQGQGPWKSYWKAEPGVGRVVHGATDRIHRIKMLGNGQVPACTYVIGKMIMEIEASYSVGN